VTTNLIARFISGSTNFEQCLPNNIDKNQNNIKIPEPNISSTTKTDNKGYTLEFHDDLKNNANTTPVARVQEIITNNHQPSEDFFDDSNIILPQPLEECSEDISDIGPYLTPTFTFAKYADKSRTIQQLVKLGVSLYKFERNQKMLQFILGLDFDRDVKPYIRFLHDCGVPADYLGEFLTKNPYILKEDMDDLYTRIRYLRAHSFTIDMIKTIVCKNPNWLLYTTKDIDSRLGYFQGNFKLNGNQIRLLTVKGPKVVTYNMQHLLSSTLTITEDMEFDNIQRKTLLLKLPRLWLRSKCALTSSCRIDMNEILIINIIIQFNKLILFYLNCYFRSRETMEYIPVYS